MQKLPKYLEPEEVKTIMNTLEEGYNVKRNQTIIWTLYTTGLRVSELVNLNRDDIVKKGQIVSNFTVNGKGNKERVIYLKDSTRDCIKKYLGMQLNSRGPLFTHGKDKRLTRTAIWKMVNMAANKAGLGNKIGPHNLRHSYAVHLLKQDVPIRYIQDLLGHSNLNTTMIYTKVSNNDLQERLNGIEF
jgi:site-specific recombinase XerD